MGGLRTTENPSPKTAPVNELIIPELQSIFSYVRAVRGAGEQYVLKGSDI